MSEKYILSIDQGTTSSRAILFSKDGKPLHTRQRELKLYYPRKGWVEQKGEDIWKDTLWACRAVMRDGGVKAGDIAAIGITNQRETTLVWDRKTGKPVYNAIVWQDRRTAAQCRELAKGGHEKTVTQKTGLLIDPYFSATKIGWILDNVDGAREKAEKGDLAFGTVDCFLLWHLTGGKVHATDATNAARTMLFDIRKQAWDKELLKLFGVPEALLPEVRDNVSDFGHTEKKLLGGAIPVGGMAGDQQAAVIGQACFSEGMVKSTYGTGCFLLMNIGPEFKVSKNRLLTTPAYRLDGTTTYAMEGSIFVAGAAIQWLRDGLGILKNAADSEAMAKEAMKDHGIYFVPAFTGLGAPWWDPDARAAILGLTRENTAAEIICAALQAQAYQTKDLMDAIRKDSGHDPEVIRADGGLVANNFMCQFLSDMLDKPVEIPVNTETTAQGAAYLAGLHAGFYKDLKDIGRKWKADRKFRARMKDDRRKALYAGWQESIRRILTSAP